MQNTVIGVLFVLGLSSSAHAGRGGGHHSGGGGGHSHAGSHSSGSSSSSHSVRGYTKRDGTSVSSHRASNPDHTQHNNFSTKGNTNPFTGAAGTRSATH